MPRRQAEHVTSQVEGTIACVLAAYLTGSKMVRRTGISFNTLHLARRIHQLNHRSSSVNHRLSIIIHQSSSIDHHSSFTKHHTFVDHQLRQ